MSNTKLFSITFKNFNNRTEHLQNVPLEYFNLKNNFTNQDIEFISNLRVTEDLNYPHSYTRGPGIKEAPQQDQPNNTFKVIRTQ